MASLVVVADNIDERAPSAAAEDSLGAAHLPCSASASSSDESNYVYDFYSEDEEQDGLLASEAVDAAEEGAVVLNSDGDEPRGGAVKRLCRRGCNDESVRFTRVLSEARSDAASPLSELIEPRTSVPLNESSPAFLRVVVSPPVTIAAPPETAAAAATRARLVSLEASRSQLHLFEARQGHLEGSSERLAGVLDMEQLEAMVLNLRNVPEVTRAAFVIGAAITPAERSASAATQIAQTALLKCEGGLPALRRRIGDAASGVLRSLSALTSDDDRR